MEYRLLGNSGLKVSVVGLGSNTFGQHTTIQHFMDESASGAVIDRAADLGINFIDTADMYSNGVSETYIGKAIAGRRDQFVIATKVGMPSVDGPNDAGLSRMHIMNSIESSLRRLGTDYVDLYYAHFPDATTPMEETMRTFDDLISQGKVRYIGCSNHAGWQIADGHAIAEHRGLAQFTVSQSSYNLFDRSIEAEVVPCCVHYGMSIVAYAPLAQGVLTGKYRRGEPVSSDSRAWRNTSENMAAYLTDAHLAMVQRLDAWAGEYGRRVGDLAVAWLVARPFVCSVLVGVTSIKQLESNVKAAEWSLTPEQAKKAADMAEEVASL